MHDGTNTEEGAVMATVLAYARDQAYTSSDAPSCLNSGATKQVRQLVERGVLELDARRDGQARMALQ